MIDCFARITYPVLRMSRSPKKWGNERMPRKTEVHDMPKEAWGGKELRNKGSGCAEARPCDRARMDSLVSKDRLYSPPRQWH